jgi:lipopolysaccharide assembly outer membrane protein LptD (OstA)
LENILQSLAVLNRKLISCAHLKVKEMKFKLLLLFMFMGVGTIAQETPAIFEGKGIIFSGDHSVTRADKQIVEFTGNVHFSTSIVEIEKAEKIVYDKKTRTFTISGFDELLLNGKKRLASDLGSTTLKIDLGGSIAYLIAESKNCRDGKGKNC